MTKQKKNSFEGKFIRNIRPSKETEKDWKFEHAMVSSGIEFESAQAAIPDSCDLRFEGWKINHQGETGGCVGWSLADGVLKWHFVHAKKIRATDTLSPRFTWMASKETDEFTTRPTSFIENEGTSLKAGLEVSRKYGAVPNKILPFNSKSLYQGELEDFYAIAARYRINAYFNLEVNPDKVKAWIATNGPVLARLEADKTWDNCGKNGILDKYVRSKDNAGHAVCIVGYTPQHFIIRNSWGTEWGKHGYGMATASYFKDAFTETYGVRL